MNDVNDLFYVCSLIEYIGRDRKLRRAEVVSGLGEKTIRRIYRYADTFHCEPIAKVADDFITMCNLPIGDFDNVSACRYDVPGYWDIGAVYARLIEDVHGDSDMMSCLVEVYASWMSDALSRFNSDLFYQPREYIAECYRAGYVIAA
jgi:hypothetical protein